MQRAVREHFNFNWDKHGSFRSPTPSALHHHGLLSAFGQIGVSTIEIVAIGPALQFFTGRKKTRQKRTSPDGLRRALHPRTRPGAWRRTSPSCRNCCAGGKCFAAMIAFCWNR